MKKVPTNWCRISSINSLFDNFLNTCLPGDESKSHQKNIFESMIFLLPFGGLSDRSYENIPSWIVLKRKLWWFVFCRMSGPSPCLHKLVMLFIDAASCSKYKLQIGLDPSTLQGLQCTSFSFYQKFGFSKHNFFLPNFL